MKKILFIVLLGSLYITSFGQYITQRPNVNHAIGILPVVNGGTNSSTASSARGNLGITNQKIGYLFSDVFSSSSNYTQITSTGTQTFSTSPTSVSITGNNGNFTNNYMIYNYCGTTGTLLDEYKISTTLVSTANYSGSYGPAVGLYQYQFNSSSGINTFAVALSTQAAGTRGTIYIVDPYNGSVLATSATALSFTNSIDSIQLELKFFRGNIIGLARNITTTTRSESGVNVPNVTTVTYTLSPSDANIYSRKGKPCIWSYGGSQTYRTLSLYSDLLSNPGIIYMGDSRVYGYGASSFNNRYVAMLGFNGDDSRAMLWCRSSMMIAEFTTAISELTTIINGGNPYVIIEAGTNDITAGHSLSTIQTDYIALLSAIKTAGGIPIVSKIAYRSTAAGSYVALNAATATFNTWIGTLGYISIDESLNTTSGGNLISYYTTDGLHFNDLGNLLMAKNLFNQINAFYRLTPNFSICGAVDILSGTSITGITSLSSSFIFADLSKNGKTINLNFALYGSGSGTTMNFTLPPILTFNLSSSSYYPSALLSITYDNSAFSTTIGYCNTNSANPGKINCYTGFPAAVWTNSGNREVAALISLPLN